MIIPTVIEKTNTWERAYDIYSRLLEDRIVFLWTKVDSAIANSLIAQLLFLEKQDPDKDIIMYINSPGGSVTAGLAIYDTMQYVKCNVATVCLWMAASMGSLLLSSGSKWKRFVLPNSEVMIHQPLGWVEWQATDIQIHADHILKTKSKLNRILARNTWQNIKKIEKDVERDNFMDAKEAMNYGIADEIINSKDYIPSK